MYSTLLVWILDISKSYVGSVAKTQEKFTKGSAEKKVLFSKTFKTKEGLRKFWATDYSVNKWSKKQQIFANIGGILGIVSAILSPLCAY